MIDGERLLDPVHRQLPLLVHSARVVDQHVEPVELAQHLPGERADGRLRGEVAEEARHVPRAAAGLHLRHGRLGTPRIAAHQEHPGPAPGELDRGLEPDAARRAGDQDGLSLHGSLPSLMRTLA